MAKQKEMVSARVNVEVLEVLEHVAAVERRPVSAVVRNALEDWAKGRQNHGGAVAA